MFPLTSCSSATTGTRSNRPILIVGMSPRRAASYGSILAEVEVDPARFGHGHRLGFYVHHGYLSFRMPHRRIVPSIVPFTKSCTPIDGTAVPCYAVPSLFERCDMARKRKPTDAVALQVRMPEVLRQRLATEAEKANRSLNSEVLWRLGQTFGEEWQRFTAGVEDRERRDQENLERIRQDPRMQELIAKIIADMPKKEGTIANASPRHNQIPIPWQLSHSVFPRV